MKTNQLTIIFSFFLLLACTDATVYSDFDAQINFTSYKTYLICSDDMDVENINQPIYDNTFNRKYIGKAITAEMNKIGYQKDELNADLQVNFQIIINDRSTTIKSCSGIGVYDYWPNCQINTYDYTEGTLVIAVSDINKNQIIWQGSAKGILDITPEKMEAVINKIVKQIFQSYPISVKTKKQEG